MTALAALAAEPTVLPAWAGGIILAVLVLGGVFGGALYRRYRSRR